jgi:hypothetical protein
MKTTEIRLSRQVVAIQTRSDDYQEISVQRINPVTGDRVEIYHIINNTLHLEFTKKHLVEHLREVLKNGKEKREKGE